MTRVGDRRFTFSGTITTPSQLVWDGPAPKGYRVLGTVGYGYSGPVAGLNLVPLYRCKTGAALHFVSTDPNCEGQETNELLGYARP